MILKTGVNVANGEITYEAVAKDLGYDYVSVEKALEKELYDYLRKVNKSKI